MTAYSSSSYITPNTNATESVSVRAVSSAVRIIKVTFQPGSGGQNPTQIFSYASATQTGGTALAITPNRAGAPAATATAKRDATVTGTSALLFSSPVTPWSPASDLIIPIGGVFYFINTVASGGNLLAVTVEFEELHLARST